MRTDNLIATLAADVAPVNPRSVERRFVYALLCAVCGALVLLLPIYGVRADLPALIVRPAFWVKVAFPLALACAAIVATARLSRPGAALGRVWSGFAAPVALASIAALAVLWFAPQEARLALLMGHTWRTCSLNIALLSAPGLVAILAAVRSLAPTRLPLAGATAGLLAGAVGALAYCLRCPETSVPFWATWYLLGMAIPAVVGALLGRLVLRW
ncbi:DUF1109 domain-containing protein [Paraburkholderia jirisanensis]